MRNRPNKLSRTKLSRAALLAVLSLAGTSQLQAANVTWSNTDGSFAWGASNPNWGGSAWTPGSGAIFTAVGAGAISLTDPIRADNLYFKANGYTVNGPVPLNLGTGSVDPNWYSSGAGRITTDPGVTARINTAINAGTALVKAGGGTLELAGPLSFNGQGVAFITNGTDRYFVNDLYISGYSQVELGGTVKLMNSSVLPTNTRVGIGNGVLDIGINNVTLGALNFINQADSGSFNAATNIATTGITGTGTLRVTGEIAVRGTSVGNDGANTIGTNLDIGSGTQIIRSSANGTFSLYRALQITGSISGSGNLLKTTGMMENGAPGKPDGLSLFGNNTYTGSTILNGGFNLVTGTNASTLVRVSGNQSLNGTNQLYLAGANGSYLAATQVQAFAGAQLYIDNDFSMPDGVDAPIIPAGNNGNRIGDTARVELRDGNFGYNGAKNLASSESFGSLAAMGGFNVLSMTQAGTTGTITLTVNGDLTLDPRATMQITSTKLGAAHKVMVNGSLPATDSTGIVTRVVGSSDFLTYNATTGLTPLTAASYSSSFAAGTNVAQTAAATIGSSVTINALKRTGSFVTTISDGQTLGISSGMILNTSGTNTMNGGTVAFGDAPGVFFGGTHTINSAITGTQGLINPNATLTLAGNLSGLSGHITNNGFTTMATNTFAGAIEVRNGGLTITTNQTLAGQGAIILGVHENDANLLANTPQLILSNAGLVMGRDLIVDNGGQDAAGMQFWYSALPSISPISNASGSQTVSGNVVLNSPLRLQGGGASATSTGSTNFTGNISGPAMFYVTNGRANFSGNVSNAGGFRIGESGFTAQVTFSGTTSGKAPITLMGGNNTSLSFAAGSLPTGTLTVKNGYGNIAPTLIPLATSTIGNDIVGSAADIKIQTGAGITATVTGAVTSGTDSYLMKQGAGTLVLTNAANSVGSTQVNGGTLLVNGKLGGLGVAVNTGGLLGGTGSISGEILVNAGGTVSAGAGGIGALSADKLTLTGSMLAELDLGGNAADWLNIGSGVALDGSSSLQLGLSGLPSADFSGTYLLLSQGGAGAISGAFSSISGMPAGYSVSVDYAFNGTDSLGRIGDGNDLAVHISAVPEPSGYAMFLAGGSLLAWLGRRRRHAR